MDEHSSDTACVFRWLTIDDTKSTTEHKCSRGTNPHPGMHICICGEMHFSNIRRSAGKLRSNHSGS